MKYQRTTQGIRVSVQPRFSLAQSDPSEGRFVFLYHVLMENQSAEPAQLLFRHWRIHEAGGTVVPSTDVGAAPLQVPGFAFHRELALLVESGISERDVLRGATSTAARVLRREAELGTLEPGKLADVLILDGDPLRDIHDTRKLAVVIRGGRIFDPAAVLARIET